jgi:dehydrogenase/reductase SDR family member 7
MDIMILPMDMLNIKSHQACLNQVLGHFKTLDILVNNAGRSQRAGWNEIDLSVDRELFELDVFAVINLSRLTLNYFINNSKRGHLAVTSSSAGLIGAPMSGSYTGAKHALHGYYECLRNEITNLDITLFCPGPTFSNFLQEAYTGVPGQVKFWTYVLYFNIYSLCFIFDT